jgi:hypothetical protein
MTDPTSFFFTNTIFNSPPLPRDALLPSMPSPDASAVSKDPFYLALPAANYTTTYPPLSFVHRRHKAPEPTRIWDGSSGTAKRGWRRVEKVGQIP